MDQWLVQQNPQNPGKKNEPRIAQISVWRSKIR